MGTGPGPIERRTVLRGALAAVAAGALAPVSGGCAGPDPEPYPRLVLATGPPGAVYREIGAALADELRTTLPGTRIEVRGTSASTENLRLLGEGAAQIAPVSLDSARGRSGGMAALCRLYDSYLHLMVRADSDVEGLADLDGRRVSFGADESGTEYTVGRLVEATGARMDGVLMNQAESARALEEGRIDAMFSLTGIPTPAITDLAGRVRLRAVDLGEAADTMAGEVPGVYLPAILPASGYEGVAATPTLTLPNILLARADLPDDVAATVTATVFTRSSELAARRPEAAQINIRTGIATGNVPLHPGAARWFREQKL
ncbi:TAXI family TRAP transporter solute-binding subunit [Nocardiopsis suaedae]|uniref:TAXI family TRAP transporter solute-binding subunit n=1 Tax=Nocardiopsis suaedae TaxID=3018444 RepID=A0ABT4TLL6_9ACTN|nr:TAXI family TRAP transporter solute-binding subunit [Nocardiopsis suaedae]MDA2805593.1 TAXI family TRAP transporter solute-binding subunit [Nocardiopsis suaedae]